MRLLLGVFSSALLPGSEGARALSREGVRSARGATHATTGSVKSLAIGKRSGTRFPWTVGEFPDPRVNLDLCGRGGKKSYICDPERLLSSALLDSEDVQLAGLEHTTPVLDVQGTTTTVGVSTGSLTAAGGHEKLLPSCSEQGFQVYTAIVDDIDRNYMGHYWGLEEASREFGRALGEKWKVLGSPCQNGVVVVYVVSERYMAIVTDTGPASAALPEELARHVSNSAVKAFQKSPDDVFSHALGNLNAIFRGAYDSHRLEYDRMIIFVYVLSGTFALIFTLLSACGLYDGVARWRHRARFRSCRKKIKSVHDLCQRPLEELPLCPICVHYLPKTSDTKNSKGANVSTSFICGHRFHVDCVDAWNRCSHVDCQGRCPVCELARTWERQEEEGGRICEDEFKVFLLHSLHQQYPDIISEENVQRWASCNTETWLAELSNPRYLSIWHSKE